MYLLRYLNKIKLMRKNYYLSMIFLSMLGAAATASTMAVNSEVNTVQMDKKTKSVSGRIVDVNGMAIIGANVIVKGTSNGTITDIDGNFVLQVPAGSSLLISYVGYVNKTVKVTSKSGYKIVLKEDAELLGNVVVVGYGSQKKRT